MPRAVPRARVEPVDPWARIGPVAARHDPGGRSGGPDDARRPGRRGCV